MPTATSSKLILIAFMLVSVSTLSTGHKISDKDLKLLCSKTGHLGGCYKLLKSDHRTANVDEKGLVEVSIDLASNNAKKIHSMFNSLAKTARDSQLRNAYYLCSKNYNDAIRNLEVAKNDSSIISIALILAIAVPSSLAHREHHRHHHKHHHRHHHKHHHHGEHDRDRGSDLEQQLKDLCSHTRESKQCRNILKSERDRFDGGDWRSVAVAAFDIAIEKADEIHDNLNGLHRDSNDDELKEKYISCSKNYNDAHRNLDLAKKNLDSDDFHNISVEVDDVEQELKNCRHEFDDDTFDPAHIGDRNKEFGNYLDIVKAAMDWLQRD